MVWRGCIEKLKIGRQHHSHRVGIQCTCDGILVTEWKSFVLGEVKEVMITWWSLFPLCHHHLYGSTLEICSEIYISITLRQDCHYRICTCVYIKDKAQCLVSCGTFLVQLLEDLKNICEENVAKDCTCCPMWVESWSCKILSFNTRTRNFTIKCASIDVRWRIGLLSYIFLL